MKGKTIYYYTFFLLIFSLIAPAICFPQNIEGVVRDNQSGAPIEDAEIIVKTTTQHTLSASDGTFEIKDVASGRHEIKISLIGYQTVLRSINVSADSVVFLRFALQRDILTTQPIAVSGERFRDPIAVPSSESPALEGAISTVNRQEIKRQGAKVLIDALQYTPGALIETRGRKVKQFFSIRGQRYPYPEYAINGAWQREFHELPYFFSSSDIEQIEVIRSSAALLTGLSGMAGVINVKTKKYNDPQTTATLEYGSFDAFRTHVSHGATKGTIAYATGAGFQRTSGPSDRHAAESMSNFYGSVDWKPSEKLVVTANLFHLYGKRELATAKAPATERFQNELSVFDPYRATLTNLRAFYRPGKSLSSELLLYYSQRRPHFEVENYKTHEISQSNENDHEWGANFTQSITLFDNNILRFGGLYNHWVAPNGKRFYSGKRCDLETFSAVIVDEQRIGSLILNSGLRWAKTYLNEYGAFSINGSGKGFKNVEPVKNKWDPSIFQGMFGGAYYFPGQLSLHFNAAVGQVQPRTGTLDVNFQKPNNEQRFKIDLSIGKSWERFGRIMLSGFFVRQNDAIVLSGETESIDNRVMELYLNRDQEQLGIELDMRSVQVFDLAEAFFNLSAMKNSFESNGVMKTNKELPEFITSGGIYARYSSFDIAIFGKYISSFESTRFAAGTADNPATPQPLGDFISFDGSLGWSFSWVNRTRCYLEFKNLTDEGFSTVVGYPDFGRRVTFGLSVTL